MQKDLGRAREAAGQEVVYEVADTALHDLDTDQPFGHVHRTADGHAERLDADVVVGCDGSFGPCRAAVPEDIRQTWERTYPYSWLGILADVAPSTDELIYAWHPDGLRAALDAVGECQPALPAGPATDTDIAEWSDERIWDQLAARLGHGQDGWALAPGPDHRQERAADAQLRAAADAPRPAVPRRRRRPHRAADRREGAQPRRRRRRAARARRWPRCCAKNDPGSADAYSDTALRRVWRCTHFSWWMTTMLHTSGDAFDDQLQLSQLRWVRSSEAGATGLAENYAGLPIGF